MVRRDVSDLRSVRLDWISEACCAFPAGESPAPVGAGAPGSRSQGGGEIPRPRAGRRKPTVSGEQVRGPQHEVKPAASKEKQSGGRAAHFTAKATRRVLVPERARRSGGVRGAARVQGDVRNTGGPSVRPVSGQGVSYKPKAKSSAAQRESEGIGVLQLGAGPRARTSRRRTRREGRVPALIASPAQVSAREWPA